MEVCLSCNSNNTKILLECPCNQTLFCRPCRAEQLRLCDLCNSSDFKPLSPLHLLLLESKMSQCDFCGVYTRLDNLNTHETTLCSKRTAYRDTCSLCLQCAAKSHICNNSQPLRPFLALGKQEQDLFCKLCTNLLAQPA